MPATEAKMSNLSYDTPSKSLIAAQNTPLIPEETQLEPSLSTVCVRSGIRAAFWSPGSGPDACLR
jgi:hypothetical protein